MQYSLESLKDTFEQFSNSPYDGVQGVLKFESAVPGPVVGITACTHGNEPAGLATFQYLIETLRIADQLKKGSIYFVLNNIAATEQFFEATTDEERRSTRYVDTNMNRLPKDVELLKDDLRYEIRRALELLPIWRQFTVGLDIHSTHVPTKPMIISRGNDFSAIEKLIFNFPITNLISNIDTVQVGIPAFALYGAKEINTPVFAVEAGQHTLKETFERACICTESLLRNLGMIEGHSQDTRSDFQEYVVEGSVVFDDISFDLVKDFQSYDSIQKGDLLARSTNGQEILAPFTGHILLPTNRRGANKDISEEAAFLTRPAQIRHT